MKSLCTDLFHATTQADGVATPACCPLNHFPSYSRDWQSAPAHVTKTCTFEEALKKPNSDQNYRGGDTEVRDLLGFFRETQSMQTVQKGQMKVSTTHPLAFTGTPPEAALPALF